jgi:hypothetical protein
MAFFQTANLVIEYRHSITAAGKMKKVPKKEIIAMKIARAPSATAPTLTSLVPFFCGLPLLYHAAYSAQ